MNQAKKSLVELKFKLFVSRTVHKLKELAEDLKNKHLSQQRASLTH